MVFDPGTLDFADTRAPVAIRAATVLPAVRENIELTTSDGLTLVGELALPADGVVRATLITLHPLPTHGGFMDSHVFKKASYRLPALAGIAVLRFNTRGTSSPRGTSGGAFDEGVGERLDLEAAVRFAVDRGLPNRWLVGWSFGTELVLKYGALDPVAAQVEGAVLLSPPLHRAGETDVAAWAAAGKPVSVLVPEFDDYLRPDAARERFAQLPQARLVAVAGAKHLWVGEKYAARALNEIASTVLGQRMELAAEWHGPVATAPSA
ncbi:alpha/beta hydrolase [Arthrobacter livingstonensis]|uniref:Alpha/beta hydrolase n=1 Tax=Arthrobacter livingstonensis TaxID=670078 RepID=A0A2V5LDQ4_9MICC|nr:alpha/beta hydrolase [Arthrobacter livingstonensis]PYI68704.1 alpha/beta hydrolase [Arthrobacter livingstonensis]